MCVCVRVCRGIPWTDTGANKSDVPFAWYLFIVDWNRIDNVWGQPCSGITNDIKSVAFFFTINGERIGRPSAGLFHMRHSDTMAVHQLVERSAGFSAGV